MAITCAQPLPILCPVGAAQLSHTPTTRDSYSVTIYQLSIDTQKDSPMSAYGPLD
jgi:hypothetical protein